MRQRWSADRANAWYRSLTWPVGCNFIPSTAINQLEMWQEETFDPETIERELGWAAGLGMNTARVFLHDLAWQSGPERFKDRVGRYLDIARGRGIRTILVLFDDCWYPDPKAGPQPAPRPGLHNSGWVQSPGARAAADPAQRGRLEEYVRDVAGSFAGDDRVLMWDLYNELGNFFLPVLSLPWYRRIPKLAAALTAFLLLPPPTLPLFRDALSWIRDVGPSQPVTAAVWIANARLNREIIESSDIVTFHNYKHAGNLAAQIGELKKHGRPLLCTEYLARNAGSRFETCLPVLKNENVGCCSWGLVSGKTQTIYSWADRGGGREPAVWYHDIFRKDGTPFDAGEAAFIRRITDAGLRA